MVLVSKRKRNNETELPAHVVYEEIDGKALPYKGFRDVLANKKQIEEIVGSSQLQAYIVSLIYGFLFNRINRKEYWLLTNEPGVHISRGTNLSNDIAIYARDSGLDIFSKEYAKFPPKIAIEVDTKIEFDEETYPGADQYVLHKSQKLIDFGTEKVVWVLTESRRIFVLEAGKPVKIVDFDADIPLVDGCIVNLNQLLKEEGVQF